MANQCEKGWGRADKSVTNHTSRSLVGCATLTAKKLGERDHTVCQAGQHPDHAHSGCTGFHCWFTYVQTFVYVYNALLYIHCVIIHHYVLRQVHSLLQRVLSTECGLLLLLSIYHILCMYVCMYCMYVRMFIYIMYA